MKNETSNVRRINPRFTLLTTCLFAVLAFAGFAAAKEIKKSKLRQATKFATSRDGTKIAYDKVGKGPALVIVGGALSARSGASEFAEALAPHFTVYSYDRRGRGESGDTKPYSVRREIEDLEAVIEAAGGSAYVYGKSSGASLSLRTAALLGDKIPKLALYEAPYSEAEGAAEEWKALRVEIDKLLAAGRRAEAVSRFLEFTGAPKAAIAGMKASPAWKPMVAMAPTLAYDNAVVGEDRSVPVQAAAKVKAKTLVMDGGASAKTMPFMRPTADKIARAIPDADRRTLDGQDHDVDPKVLTEALVRFFLK
jgi:pimeloyl-ACP methyl ester carboxylesterase